MTWRFNQGKCQPAPKRKISMEETIRWAVDALESPMDRSLIADRLKEALQASPSREPARDALADELVLRWKHTGLSSKLGRHTAISKDELNLIVAALRSVPDGAAGEPIDQEKFCIAFSWAYGTELEKRHFDVHADDGMTPETLWYRATSDERNFMRKVVASAFAALPPVTPPSDERAKVIEQERCSSVNTKLSQAGFEMAWNAYQNTLIDLVADSDDQTCRCVHNAIAAYLNATTTLSPTDAPAAEG